MNKLYNKIYEAIDNGIQKALIISDEQANDVSVDFHHKKITSDVNMLNQYVQELLNSKLDTDEPKYNYRMVKEYYRLHKKRYIVKDFNELVKIYYKLILFEDPDSINLNWIDMHNAVSVILNDGTEKDLIENMVSENVKFVKFKNNETGHDIIMLKNIMDDNNLMQWKIGIEYEHFNDNEIISGGDIYTDYNGYEHTYINSNNQNGKFPALEHCKSQSIPGYEGYLPALGELIFLREYDELINYILKAAGSARTFVADGLISVWSSSEASETGVWGFSYGGVDVNSKTQRSCYAMPLFKKVNI